ncbi:putative alkyl/aryl-sulfatase YjcS [Colletotrichum higginsianum]|uniref:Putative alkyl/aryl-sulfatase YjcS n=1 Tax=Colletotrichum higginsianum TaxID=80884 RepID=A0A4T0VXE6_9PEZI|nr:putative alkyl/aryl-sulfatase YjcS [Colletotrichum higginsianum]
MTTPKHATPTIIKQQKDVKNSLPFSDTLDYDNARKGFIKTNEHNIVYGDEKVDDEYPVVWNNDEYAFLKHNKPPYTVNPSLWRQSQLSSTDGLFLVTEGIYQVRGFDLSNTTFIEGNEGVIVIDPLTSVETGRAALELYSSHRPGRPVKAVIYTHSHVDHFGGVRGMVCQDDVDNELVEIIAPEGFLEHAVAENVYAGTAMSRRAAYMYGATLDRGVRGQVGAGLGQTTSTGKVTLIPPTMIVSRTGKRHSVDGVKMEFQMAPDTEAPSEMLIYFPDFKALCAAEDATHTFHNLLTLRGAVVRDPHGWSKYLTETIDLFGDKTDVVFASHHWPTWGANQVVEFLTLQRDLYAYVHDQTLRMLNQGYNGPEIAEIIQLPPALEQAWNARGYYGSVSHNVKAIYQRYMGWFDGNPAHLWEHVPVERSKRYVRILGGVENTVEIGQEAYDQGDFRWAAEILNHAVFACPEHTPAKHLLADTYEQLGYGSENGTWRNFFLSGTTELRTGNFGTPTVTASDDVIRQLTPEMLFDSLAIQINGSESWKVSVVIDVRVIDTKTKTKTKYRLWLSNGALVYTTSEQTTPPDVTLTATAADLTALATPGIDVPGLEEAGIKIIGDKSALERLAGLLDPGDPAFNIVTP